MQSLKNSVAAKRRNASVSHERNLSPDTRRIRRGFVLGGAVLAALMPAPGRAEAQTASPSESDGTVIALLDTSAALQPHRLALPGFSVAGEETPAMPKYGHAQQMARTMLLLLEDNGAVKAVCADKCAILPIKTVGWENEAFTTRTAEGINAALARGADIINMSYSGPSSPEIRQAVDNAIERGAVVINSAGNENADIAANQLAADNPALLVVTALDSGEQNLWPHSTWGAGANAPDIAAKGVVPTLEESGTSVSAAYVSALAAAAKRLNPGISQNELVEKLQLSGTRLPSLIGRVACACKLDVAKFLYAMGYAEPAEPAPTPRQKKVVVKISRTGRGNVLAGGQSCADSRRASCSRRYTVPAAKAVTVRAVPRKGAVFQRWSGLCTGRRSVCRFTPARKGVIKAIFSQSKALKK